MGCYTHVELAVPEGAAKAAQALFDEEADEDLGSSEGVTRFSFAEVNYANLAFIPLLREHGIAYDSRWDEMSEYSAGVESCRFTEAGEIQVKEISDDSLSIPLVQLKEYIDKPEQLRKFILAHEESITVLPWDNQVEYGKRYRLRQLITA